MANTTTSQALGERIERLVQDYISETRIAAQAAMDRAFATSAGERAKKQDRQAKRRMSSRRPSAELVAIGERLYAAMCNTPGETMTVLAPAVGCSARELHRPMSLLKQAGRVRSVGNRQGTRYYPMLGGGRSSS
jgi:cytochrome c5